MTKNRMWLRGTALLVAVVMLLCVSSCGTLLYPERRGQLGGRIDAGVAVLDGIGLLCFIIPGIIAFAVDFSTGAIYLPSGSSKLDNTPPDFKHAQVIHLDPALLRCSEIESRLEQQTGKAIALASPETKVAKVTPGHTLAWGSVEEVLTPSQLATFEAN